MLMYILTLGQLELDAAIHARHHQRDDVTEAGFERRLLEDELPHLLEGGVVTQEREDGVRDVGWMRFVHCG
ncbi:hypothetical protein JKA73_21670 [Myxococcus xanthus]|nr:hypothetical protein JKA73_21670 [Myxococcus xanthus]